MPHRAHVRDNGLLVAVVHRVVLPSVLPVKVEAVTVGVAERVESERGGHPSRVVVGGADDL